jgi:hypothetical protein
MSFSHLQRFPGKLLQKIKLCSLYYQSLKELKPHMPLAMARGLRHELSSLARTLESWVRISLKGVDVWVCVYSVFVLSCLLVAALRGADPLSRETYRLCKRSRN